MYCTQQLEHSRIPVKVLAPRSTSTSKASRWSSRGKKENILQRIREDEKINCQPLYKLVVSCSISNQSKVEHRHDQDPRNECFPACTCKILQMLSFYTHCSSRWAGRRCEFRSTWCSPSSTWCGLPVPKVGSFTWSAKPSNLFQLWIIRLLRTGSFHTSSCPPLWFGWFVGQISRQNSSAPLAPPTCFLIPSLAFLVLQLDPFSSGVLWRFGDSPSLHNTPSLKRSREKTTTGRSTQRRQDADSNYQSFTLLLRASSGWWLRPGDELQ